MNNTLLNIVIVGKDADKIMNSAYVKTLIEAGDNITLGDATADIVIGTTAVRTYHNTTQFLKGIVKKIRQEKETGSMAIEPIAKVKKKVTSKKKVKTDMDDTNFIQLNPMEEQPELLDVEKQNFRI